MRFFLILCVFVAGLAAPAMAQQADNLVKPGQTVLNISASETKTTQQDLLIASMRFEAQGADSSSLQNKINTMMAKALAGAREASDVQVTTDNYYVYPYDPNQFEHPDPESTLEHREKSPIIWKGAQSIELKSKNSEQLLKLVGELQEMGFQISNLSYTLSPEAFEDIRDGLLESALKKLSEKADRAAKALGKREAELVEVSVDTAYPTVPMPMMARAMVGGAVASEKAAPVASPGQSDITLTVSARALLK